MSEKDLAARLRELRKMAAKTGQLQSAALPIFDLDAILAALEDAERYRNLVELLTTAHAGFISVNEHRLGYEDEPHDGAVQIQWYPDTPIGVYKVNAHTLDAAIDAARKEGA